MTSPRTPGKAPALRLLADNLASQDERKAAVDLILDGKRLLTDDELASLGIPVRDYVRTEYPPPGERKSARLPKLATSPDTDDESWAWLDHIPTPRAVLASGWRIARSLLRRWTVGLRSDNPNERAAAWLIVIIATPTFLLCASFVVVRVAMWMEWW